MGDLWETIAIAIEKIAQNGAESPSVSILYEPEIPEELQK